MARIQDPKEYVDVDRVLSYLPSRDVSDPELDLNEVMALRHKYVLNTATNQYEQEAMYDESILYPILLGSESGRTVNNVFVPDEVRVVVLRLTRRKDILDLDTTIRVYNYQGAPDYQTALSPTHPHPY